MYTNTNVNIPVHVHVCYNYLYKNVASTFVQVNKQKQCILKHAPTAEARPRKRWHAIHPFVIYL